MSYDSSGNMTYQRDNFKDLTKTITVDSQNRITQVQDALSTTIGNYWYDEGGFRVRKKALVPSGASFKNQEILYPSKFYGLEYSEETNILSSINNVYLNGVRIAALNEDGVTAYFLTDQVDSVAHVLDEGAHTLSRMQYEPYGETLVQRGTLDFAPKYNSQELDRETNFYFYNARYYDPQIARFTSADSIIPETAMITQNWNRFSYVKGNPILFCDPTGHYDWVNETITKGDTLSQIVLDANKKWGTKFTVSEFANANRIGNSKPNVNKLKVGQVYSFAGLMNKMNEQQRKAYMESDTRSQHGFEVYFAISGGVSKYGEVAEYALRFKKFDKRFSSMFSIQLGKTRTTTSEGTTPDFGTGAPGFRSYTLKKGQKIDMSGNLSAFGVGVEQIRDQNYSTVGGGGSIGFTPAAALGVPAPPIGVTFTEPKNTFFDKSFNLDIFNGKGDTRKKLDVWNNL